MTDKEKIYRLVQTIKSISRALGIRRDFCPPGLALELEPLLRETLKSVDDDLYAFNETKWSEI